MRSRHVLFALLIATPFASTVACAQLSGIDEYDRVYCSGTGCGLDGSPDVVDRDVDSGGGDEHLPDVVVDVVPAPAATRAWARWAMPNPTGSDAGKLAQYADSGVAQTVLDAVTGLEWERGTARVATLADATNHCAALTVTLGPGWLVPTRIELVSILDPSRNPPLDPVFGDAGAPGLFWTASRATGTQDHGDYWTIDFTKAIVSNGPKAGELVRCVRRVKP